MPERRNEPLLIFSMNSNEGHPNPEGEDGKCCQRIPFDASLDEERERCQDNDCTADRNTYPVHAPLEEEIGKPVTTGTVGPLRQIERNWGERTLKRKNDYKIRCMDVAACV
jgi:hypothetical protein